MSKVIWCSVHTPTTEQLEELQSWLDEGDELMYLKDINPVLFDTLINSPANNYELLGLAKTLHELSREMDAILVQPSGSIAFQYMFGKVAMTNFYVTRVLYSHSNRVSEDIPQEDGSVKKISYFTHQCFVLV